MPCVECCNAGGKRGSARRSRVLDGTGDLQDAWSRLGDPRPFRPLDSLSIRYRWPLNVLESVNCSAPACGIVPTPQTRQAYARPIPSSRMPPRTEESAPLRLVKFSLVQWPREVARRAGGERPREGGLARQTAAALPAAFGAAPGHSPVARPRPASWAGFTGPWRPRPSPARRAPRADRPDRPAAVRPRSAPVPAHGPASGASIAAGKPIFRLPPHRSGRAR